jgi:hypothetical protein
MRRVLASLGIAALAFIAVAPASASVPQDPGLDQFGQPVVNEVATRGPAGTMDQFIEIANPSRTTAVDLSGWQLRIYNSSNTLLQVVILPEGTVLQPFGSVADEGLFVLSSTGFTGGPVNQPGAIVVDIPDTGGVALFNPGGAKIDGVAFSPAATTPLEGTPATPQTVALDFLAPSSGRSIISQDTNNNAFDFKLMVRSPGQLN